MEPSYAYAAPPGHDAARGSLLSTYYTPRRGQNLVATLTGWVDAQGRPRLVSRSLPRDPVTLGPGPDQPAGVRDASRPQPARAAEPRDPRPGHVVPRLGLPRAPAPAVPPGGADAGPEPLRGLARARRRAAARRDRVRQRSGRPRARTSTAPLRQALNEPPPVDVRRPRRPASVGTPVAIALPGRERPARGRDDHASGPPAPASVSRLADGPGAVAWVPDRAGPGARPRRRWWVSTAPASPTARRSSVLSRPPAIRLVDAPEARRRRSSRCGSRSRSGAGAGRRSQVSTRAGIVFTAALPARRPRRRRGVDARASPGRADAPSCGHGAVRVRRRRHEPAPARAPARRRRSPPTRRAASSVPARPTVRHVRPTFALPGRRTASAASPGSRARRGGVQVWRFPCPLRRGDVRLDAGRGPVPIVLTVGRAGRGRHRREPDGRPAACAPVRRRARRHAGPRSP